MTTSAATAPGPAPSLWRNRDYQLLMGGRTVSVVGGSMTGLAMMLLTTDLSHDAAQAAGVMALFVVGQVVVGIPAGAVVDRWDRKRVMVWSSLAAAFVLGTVPVAMLLERESVAHLAVVSWLIGALSSFYAPAETAALKTVVPGPRLGEAMAATQGRQALATVVGPPLAGLLYGVSRFLPMLGDAVANLVAAACAAGVRAELRPPRTDTEGSPRRLFGDIVEGLAWIVRHPVVRPIAAVACLVNFGFAIISTAVVLALKLGGTADAQIGAFEGILGAAMLAGALLSPQFQRLAPVGALFVTILAGGVALAVGSVFVHGVWGLAALFAAFSFLLPAMNSGILAYFMHIVPDRLIGRPQAAAGTLVMACVPLGNLAAGFLLQHGGRTWALVPGIAVLVLTLAMGLGTRAIREIPKAAEFSDEAADAG